MFAFVLSVVMSLSMPSGGLDEGLRLALRGQHAESEAVMSKLDPKKVPHEMYNFVRLMNNFALNKKGEATKYGRQLDESFASELPRRYRSLAYMMKNELEIWGKTGELDDIERDMRHIAGRLGNSQGGATTQKLQKEVVDKLDKLIKDQEDKKNGAAAAATAEAEKGKPGAGQQGQPALESVIMGGAGKGKIDEKELRKISESWGTMPPAARAKVIQEITRDLPPKFEPIIKNYFDALNKNHNIK